MNKGTLYTFSWYWLQFVYVNTYITRLFLVKGSYS